MTTGLPLTWPLYHSLMTGCPVDVTLPIHAREVWPLAADGTATDARSVPSGSVRTTLVRMRLAFEELC